MNCGSIANEERLRILGLTTLETLRLKAAMVEVYRMLSGFEGTDEVQKNPEKGRKYNIYKV